VKPFSANWTSARAVIFNKPPSKRRKPTTSLKEYHLQSTQRRRFPPRLDGIGWDVFAIGNFSPIPNSSRSWSSLRDFGNRIPLFLPKSSSCSHFLNRIRYGISKSLKSMFLGRISIPGCAGNWPAPRRVKNPQSFWRPRGTSFNSLIVLERQNRFPSPFPHKLESLMPVTCYKLKSDCFACPNEPVNLRPRQRYVWPNPVPFFSPHFYMWWKIPDGRHLILKPCEIQLPNKLEVLDEQDCRLINHRTPAAKAEMVSPNLRYENAKGKLLAPKTQRSKWVSILRISALPAKENDSRSQEFLLLLLPNFLQRSKLAKSLIGPVVRLIHGVDWPLGSIWIPAHWHQVQLPLRFSSRISQFFFLENLLF